jgi:allophanate hydrolase subunit 2
MASACRRSGLAHVKIPQDCAKRCLQMLTNEEYTVHYNSNRLGIRLTGPKPQFARPDGGEGGTHPSNVHDHVYALGTINFSGDMPIILTVDGPSLGGFVCPATTVSADMWKWGHVRPGDNIKFEIISLQEAYSLHQRQNARVAAVHAASKAGVAIDSNLVRLCAACMRVRPMCSWAFCGMGVAFPSPGFMKPLILRVCDMWTYVAT